MRMLIAVTVVGIFIAAIPARAATGLANVQTITTDEVPDISQPEALTISSPDGAFVYVTAPSSGIAVFARDAGTGLLGLVSTVHAEDIPFLSSQFRPHGAVIVDDITLYVGSEGGSVFAFTRNPFTGALSYLQELPTSLGRMRDIAASTDGKNLYIVDFTDDSLQVIARDTGTGLLTAGQVLEDDQGGVDGLNGVNAIAVSPDGEQVYTTSNEDKLAQFDRDPLTGNLTFVTVYEDNVGGTLKDGNDIAVSPDGSSVYIAADETSVNGPTVYSRDALTGALTFVETGPPYGTSGRNPFTASTRAVTVSADGTQVVGVSRNTVTLYDRNTLTGGLTFVGSEAQRGERVEMSPDGLHVYVASGSSSVGVFRELSIACSPTPMSGCKVPTLSQKSAVQWKNGSIDDNDKFLWKWSPGEATALAEAGDPVNGTDDVIICGYDSSASPQPVFDSKAPAGGICDNRPCWKIRGSTPGRQTLKYKDPLRRPDGFDKLDIKEGLDGFARVKAKGKTKFLVMPSLPLTLPVTVQLQSATGTCWTATYSTFQANDVIQFKAKAD